jgi:hypothetical protein
MYLLLYTILLLFKPMNLMLNSSIIIFLFQTRTMASCPYPCLDVWIPPLPPSSPTLHACPTAPLHAIHDSQADKGKDHVHASDASLHPE